MIDAVPRRLRLFIPLFLLLIVLIPFTQIAYAVTYNVGCTGGVGDTAQLVSAINSANGTDELDTINLTGGCVYTLTADLPTISTPIMLTGNGAVIDGANAYRPFTITGLAVWISGLTIRNSYKTIDDEASAILLNGGSLNVANTSFIHNGPATAIVSNAGTLTIVSSTFNDNGWHVYPSPALLMVNAIENKLGYLGLINSTITNHTSASSFTIINTGTVLISNSTISGNHAALYNLFGTATIRNSIMANSNAYDCENLGGTLTVTNTLIMAQAGSFSCGIVNGVDGNIIADPKLKPLTGNPAYLPIAADSPAFNAGNNTHVSPAITTDQAGNPRIQHDTVDLGAFEATLTTAVTLSAPVSAPEVSFNTITISRTGVTTNPLTVNLTLTRGANMTAGDYTITGGDITGSVGNVTATILAGQSSVDLTFVAFDDGVAAEPDNVLTVAIGSSADYDIGATSTTTATIPANGTNVSTLTDDTTSEGTFRQAILNANAIPGDNFIYFDIAGTIYLTSSLPDLGANGRIVVAGEGITIHGSGSLRIFNVLTGANVRLIQLSLVNGFASTDGGAILNAGTLELSRSTVQNSATAANGGAIKNESGATLTLYNSTITGNSAVNGGGINNHGTLTVQNSTVAGNSITGSSGAGLLNLGTMTLRNSIVADNNGVNCSGTVTANFSLVEDGSCGVFNGVNGNKTGDPRLGNLTGSPAFYPLLIGSIAINAGDNSLVSGSTDQPGYVRILDGTVDMGAFETTPASLNLTLSLQGRPAAPNPAYVTDVQVQIRQPGSTTPLYTGNFVTDENGSVTVPGIIAWHYDVWVKGSHTLARVYTIPLVAGVNNLTTELMLEGDANDDNIVQLTDFSMLASAFGSSTGDPNFDAQADFNNDGMVTLTDFSLLASNFTQGGAP